MATTYKQAVRQKWRFQTCSSRHSFAPSCIASISPKNESPWTAVDEDWTIHWACDKINTCGFFSSRCLRRIWLLTLSVAFGTTVLDMLGTARGRQYLSHGGISCGKLGPEISGESGIIVENNQNSGWNDHPAESSFPGPTSAVSLCG